MQIPQFVKCHQLSKASLTYGQTDRRNYIQTVRCLFKPFFDCLSPSEICSLDAEATVAQGYGKRVLHCDLCCQLSVLFGFTKDLCIRIEWIDILDRISKRLSNSFQELRRGFQKYFDRLLQ